MGLTEAEPSENLASFQRSLADDDYSGDLRPRSQELDSVSGGRDHYDFRTERVKVPFCHDREVVLPRARNQNYHLLSRVASGVKK